MSRACPKIAVANPHPYSGKTTATLAIGISLSSLGRRVLIIDAATKPDLSLRLGVDFGDDVPTLPDVLLGKASVAECIRQTAWDGLELIASDINLMYVDATLRLDRVSEKVNSFLVAMRQTLTEIESRYDYMILDTPSNLSFVCRAALNAADAFLIPCTPYDLLSGSSYKQLHKAVAELLTQRYREEALVPLGLLFVGDEDFLTRAMSLAKVQEGLGVFKSIVDWHDVGQNRHVASELLEVIDKMAEIWSRKQVDLLTGGDGRIDFEWK